MPKRRTVPSTLGRTGQTLVRIVISSYFIAAGVGFIEGVSLSPLFEQALPQSLQGLAGVGGMAMTLILAGLILTGHWLRPAALLLATALFWSSYMEMIALGVEDKLGGFWRDLALVAALMLTYTEPGDRRLRPAKLFRRRIKPRKLGEPVMPQRVGIERDRTHDPVRLPRRPVAVPVRGPQPVFFTRRGKPAVLHPRPQLVEAGSPEISNVFAIPARAGHAS
ncbi:MAG: hypothetical protein AAGK37_09765 [Pseudomonadota bacterium]